VTQRRYYALRGMEYRTISCNRCVSCAQVALQWMAEWRLSAGI